MGLELVFGELAGLFWRFIALMELARVDEAEVALAAFERATAAAGDAEASVMALSRHGMLAILRGRFQAPRRWPGRYSSRLAGSACQTPNGSPWRCAA